ncbi:hypothetical protein AB0F77_39405 [Streptomyces sp. NPDC026672]|uniref:hypothetical protein n=1 Tax=unclassified Streptomyces TaxID=2593676 RepID=UPI00340C8076
MHVLLPDDGVFRAHFHVIEKLLDELYYYYVRELEPEQAELICVAYDGWGEIYQQLPAPLQWQELSWDGRSTQQVPQGYRLSDAYGRELVPLYAVDLNAIHVERLEACQRMLARARSSPADPLGEILDELPDAGAIENFRRALKVMRIPAEPRLLEVLLRGAPTGPDTAITLDADRTAAYHTLCQEIVHRVSAGDRFTYTLHASLLHYAA